MIHSHVGHRTKPNPKSFGPTQVYVLIHNHPASSKSIHDVVLACDILLCSCQDLISVVIVYENNNTTGRSCCSTTQDVRKAMYKEIRQTLHLMRWTAISAIHHGMLSCGIMLHNNLYVYTDIYTNMHILT